MASASRDGTPGPRKSGGKSQTGGKGRPPAGKKNGPRKGGPSKGGAPKGGKPRQRSRVDAESGKVRLNNAKPAKRQHLPADDRADGAGNRPSTMQAGADPVITNPTEALDKLGELSRVSEQTNEALHNAQIDLDAKLAVANDADVRSAADQGLLDAASARAHRTEVARLEQVDRRLEPPRRFPAVDLRQAHVHEDHAFARGLMPRGPVREPVLALEAVLLHLGLGARGRREGHRGRREPDLP